MKAAAMTVLALTLALSKAPALAQDITVSKVYEHLQNAANVSGHIIVGFTYEGLPEAAQKPDLTAGLPAAWGGRTACLRLVSDDGLYEATHLVTLPESLPGTRAHIPFQTDKQDYLSTFPTGSMGVSLSLLSEGDCSGFVEEITASAWNGALEKGSPLDLTLNLNSRGADEVFLVFPEGTEIDCRKRETAQRVAFDFSCTIPGTLLPPGEPVPAEIVQIRRGNFDPSVEVNLVAQQ